MTSSKFRIGNWSWSCLHTCHRGSRPSCHETLRSVAGSGPEEAPYAPKALLPRRRGLPRFFSTTAAHPSFEDRSWLARWCLHHNVCLGDDRKQSKHVQVTSCSSDHFRLVASPGSGDGVNLMTSQTTESMGWSKQDSILIKVFKKGVVLIYLLILFKLHWFGSIPKMFTGIDKLSFIRFLNMKSSLLMRDLAKNMYVTNIIKLTNLQNRWVFLPVLQFLYLHIYNRFVSYIEYSLFTKVNKFTSRKKNKYKHHFLADDDF